LAFDGFVERLASAGVAGLVFTSGYYAPLESAKDCFLSLTLCSKSQVDFDIQ
jgi:hypothetical protein